MVHHPNHRADQEPGRIGPRRDDPWSDPPAGADQRLASLAGAAKRIRAATVYAGEGS